MILKSMQPIIVTLLRFHKRFGLVSILLLCISSSCILFQEDLFKDEYYYIYVSNSTQDTLEIILGNDEIDSFELLPGDSNNYWVGFKIYSEEDPLRDGLFNPEYLIKTRHERIQVSVNNSVVVNWIGPGRDMGPDIHHFFNYQSWEIIEGDDGYHHIVKFTIYPEDLTNK